MRGRVTIAARNCHARLRQSEFWSNHVDYALSWARQIPKRYPEFLRVSLECRQHLFSKHIGEWPSLVTGWNDVVDSGKRPFGKFYLPSAAAQHVKSLWACHLVHKMQTNEQLGLASWKMAHSVCVPDFL